MAKTIFFFTWDWGFLRRSVVHCGWGSSRVWRSNKLHFWGHLYGENLWVDLKKLETLWVLKKLKSFCSNAGLEEEAVKVRRLLKDLGHFIGLPMAEICGTDFELKLSWHVTLRRPAFQTTSSSRMIQRDLRISSKRHPCPKASSATFASQAQQPGSRLQHQMSTTSQTSYESRVQLKSASKGDEADTRVSMRVTFSPKHK